MQKIVHTICPLAGDHVLCILKVLVEDGKIIKVESTDLPQCADHRCVCSRGLSSHRMVYHPDRLQYPIKRVGGRGEGKWQRISWDEALDTIAGKLLEIKEKYGPQALTIRSPGGSSNVGFLGRHMANRFANAWGSSVFEAKGPFADGGHPAANLMVLGDSGQMHHPRDHANARMLILWGWNPAVTYMRQMKDILDARDRGAKLVVVSPMYTHTVAKADQWIPVRVGTDGALALGMINVIIEQGLHDQDYISKYTVGPLLVREDNKTFLREKDVFEGTSDKTMVFDQKSGSAVTPDSPDATPALQGRYIINGIDCKPAFQLLADRAAEYPLRKVSEITGVPAETIRNLAVEYATAKPAAMKLSHGLTRTHHSSMNCRTIITLGAITGNIGVKGGGVSAGHSEYRGQEAYRIVFNSAAVMRPPGAPGTQEIPGSNSSFAGWIAMRDGQPYPIKVLISRFQNQVQCYGHHKSYFDVFSNMDLVVICDPFMTWTARYADIVLPETTIFEQMDIEKSEFYILGIQPVIEPLHESRSAFRIWSDLAQRVGLGHFFNQTEAEVIDILLDSSDPSLEGISWDRLREEVAIRANVPDAPYTSFEDKKFPTPTGRIQFYDERLIPFGEELMSHKENLESPVASPLAGQYPLTLLTIKTNLRTHSIKACDWILELQPEPLLDINPVDAAKRDIADGQIVEVFNDRGKAKVKARLNEVVPPGTVNMDHGWPYDAYIDGHYNELLHRVDDPNQIKPSLDIEPIVHNPHSADHLNLFDCLVEVRKA